MIGPEPELYMRLCFTVVLPLCLWSQGVGPDTSAALRRHFANPPAAYRTMPFFVWNGEVTEADVDRYLEDYKRQGFGGFFVHPRVGLITPYLSDRWFEIFRYAVDKAKRLGLEVWLYDENPFPSGMAGGHVRAEMPESYNEGSGLTLRKVPANNATTCKVALPAAGEETYCFELAYYDRRGGRGYVDLLRPGVTKKFLQITMPGYERSVGREFGKTVPGIFTDEPNIAPPGRETLRWTPDFFEQFKKRRGYDVRPLLVSMFEDTGDYRRVRHDYQLTLLELFIERWSKPWFAYTEKAGLRWTGHYWEHGWPSPNDGPDNMAMYAWHQMPGIDLLFNQYDEERGPQFGCVRNVKELSSAANQLGRRRTLSETYGGSGWELRFEDMKRLGDWEYVLGVNFMNQHLSYQTLAGARKYDWPQSFSYHEPWWKHFRVLADYFARLSLALSTGEQVNHIVILEPTSTAWMYARVGKPDPRLEGVDRDFRPFLNRLEASQVEYDLASENILKDRGKVEGRQFIIGRRAYDTFVVPPGTENIDAPAVSLLESYLKQGGTVLSFVDPPARMDGAESNRIRDLAARYPDKWIKASSIDRLLTGDFTVTAGKLYHQRRQLADGELLFFVNSSLDDPARATVSANGRFVVRYDAMAGTITPYPATLDKGKLSFTIDLPPSGSLLLTTSKSGSPASTPPSLAGSDRTVEPQGPLAVQRIAPNVLRLDYCDLKLNGAVQSDIWFGQAAQKVFEQYGFRGDPWLGTQFKSEFLDKDHFPPDSGFEAIYHFDVAQGVEVKGLRAVVERPKLWHVSINGTPVESRPGEWWLDTSFGVFDIGAQVKSGANVLTVRAQPMSVHAEIQPVYILGDFGLVSQPKSFQIVSARPMTQGLWTTQSMPFYSDAVAYRRSFTLRSGAKYKVRLGKWSGTVAEVRVNGKSAGIIGWKPYVIDISALVSSGENEIEVLVYGSLKNLLGPHLTKYRPGLVGSWLWRTAPEHSPPGNQYEVIGYGLEESFHLIEL